MKILSINQPKGYLYLSILLASLSIFPSAWAVTYTVNTTNDVTDGVCDSTHCSLREAIMAANANPGMDAIEFNINNHAVGPHSIKVKPIAQGGDGPLPAIVDPVNINGFTQAGNGVYAIEISGELFPDPTSITAVVPPTATSSGIPAGLLLWGRDRSKDLVAPHESLDGPCLDASNTAGCKLAKNPDGSSIKGLMINKFPRQAIYLYGTDNITIIANYIGLDSTGQLRGYSNGTSEIVSGNFASDELRIEGSTHVFLGTTTNDYAAKVINAANRNVFGSCGRACVAIQELNENPQGFAAPCSNAVFPAGCRREDIPGKKNVVQGNYFGLDKTGMVSIGGFCANGRTPAFSTTPPAAPCTVADAVLSIKNIGIFIGGAAARANVPDSIAANLNAAQNRENVIGGLESGMGNVIASVRGDVLALRGPKNSILGNIVGLNVAESLSNIPRSPNGIVITGSGWGNLIKDNVIANTANRFIGITTVFNLPGPFDNTIRENHIGINHAGVNVSNGGLFGIFVGGDIRSTSVENNVIGFSGDGIVIQSQNQAVAGLPDTTIFTPQGIAILGNKIHNNTRLGIDLNATTTFNISLVTGLTTGIAGDGVTLNDSKGHDNPTGVPNPTPNHLQNFPVLNAAKSFINPEKAKVYGSLDSKPNQQYLIQIFANAVGDASGNGEGQVFVGEKIVTTDGAGHVDFKIEADKHSPVVKDPNTGVCSAAPVLTATATDVLTGDTSEFSQWVIVDVKGSANAYSKRCDKENEKHADDDDDANEHARDNAHD